MGAKRKNAAATVQLSLGELGGIVLAPEVLEEQRGAWCSPKVWTDRCGRFDVDPFTNPRSHIDSTYACMLERGDDGFGLDKRGEGPGWFYVNPVSCTRCHGSKVLATTADGVEVLCACIWCGHVQAGPEWRMWFQPPYDIVLQAIAHWGHTRFVALLRLDTSTDWFDQLFKLCEVLMVPIGERIEFDPPPGVEGDANPFPHALYYKRAEDVTPEVREHCYAWPTALYPWATDPLSLLPKPAGVGPCDSCGRYSQALRIVGADLVCGGCSPSCTGSLVHGEFTACPVHDG